MNSLTDWVAHASRVLIGASRADELFLVIAAQFYLTWPEDCFGETPKPARGTRAIPR